MKNLILTLSLMLALVGCDSIKQEFYGPEEYCKTDLYKCVLVKHDWALRALDEDCSKLAKCMKMDYEILSLVSQTKDPYACAVFNPKKKWQSHYYYPKARISFGEAEYDRLKDAIATCEMMTETGEKSKSYYDGLMATFAAMDKERAERNKQMEEAKRPRPSIKIRVVK